MMPCERIQRLAKTAASGQRTTPRRLTQRRVARHAHEMSRTGRRTASPSTGALWHFRNTQHLFIRAGWGDRDG